MIPKDKRLTRDLFKQLSLERRGLHSPHFVLKEILPKGYARMGVSVSKKVSKKAVIRNRTRRRVYAELRALLPFSKTILIIAKPGAERLKGNVLKTELAELIKKS
ncbi:MAG: ribonuclease P protein component [Parcubacteria group bacterium]